MLLLLPLLIQCRKKLQHREFRQLGWQLFCSDNRHCLPWAMQNCYVSNRLPPSSTYHLTEDLPPKWACWNAASFNFGKQGKASRDSPTEISRSLASSIVQTEHTAHPKNDPARNTNGPPEITGQWRQTKIEQRSLTTSPYGNKDNKLSEWCAYHQCQVVLVHIDCCYFFA